MAYNNELGRLRLVRNCNLAVPSIGFNKLRQADSTALKHQQVGQIQFRQNPPLTIDPTRAFLQFRSYQSHTNEKPKSYRGSTYHMLEQDRLTQETPMANTDREVLRQQYQQKQTLSATRNFNPMTTRSRFAVLTQMTDYTNRTRQKQKLVEKTNNLQKIPSKNLYEVLCPVGKGGFGKVWKVCLKKNRQIYAMKQMHKAKIIQKKSINSVMNERNLLAKLRHPFLINMNCAFQDRQNLYLTMDYINGGDLRYHIGKYRKFSENQTKFLIANIIVGLDYLHSNKIIHRDIKPENLVFGSDGYLRITDLGISRELREYNYQDTSGTPGYMSPEVICRKNHSFQADFFALGVIGFELMLAKRPYNGKDRKQIRQIMLSKQAGIKLDQLPRNWSPDAIDFINRLLIRSPSQRLGYGGINQLKYHPWMRSINWLKLTRKQIHPPYIPMSIEDDYEEYRKQISEDTIPENIEENLLMLRDNQVQSLFEGYAFTSNHYPILNNTTRDFKGKRSTSTAQSESTSGVEVYRA